MFPLNRRSGIALVSVLWLLLCCPASGRPSSTPARVEALMARHAFDLARAQAAADAAVVDTISRLADEDAGRRPSIGLPQQRELDGIPVSVTMFEKLVAST
jgi:hypothetical protein